MRSAEVKELLPKYNLRTNESWKVNREAEFGIPDDISENVTNEPQPKNIRKQKDKNFTNIDNENF